MKTMFEDDLPEDMPQKDYDKWFSLSWVDGVRVGPMYPFEHDNPADLIDRIEELASEHMDPDADPEDKTPEDMHAWRNGIIFQLCQQIRKQEDLDRALRYEAAFNKWAREHVKNETNDKF